MVAKHHLQYCLEKAAKEGSSAHYCMLFAPKYQKPAFLGLFALAAELRDIPRLITDEKLARLKLMWWEKEMQQAAEGCASHPASICLGMDTLKHIPLGVWKKLFEACAHELGQATPFFSENEWLIHDLNMGGSFFYIGGVIAGVKDVRNLNHLQQWGARSQQLTTLLRIGKVLRLGCQPLPVDILQNHHIPAQQLRSLSFTKDFSKMMEHTSSAIVKAGELHWALMDKTARRQLRPLRSLWRMRLQEWQLARQNQYDLMHHSLQLTPLKKFQLAWTSFVLGR